MKRPAAQSQRADQARRAARATRAALERRLVLAEAKIQQLARTLQLVEDVRTTLADQYDFAPLGFVTLDDKGCVREMNLTAARLLGCERSRVLTMPFLSHVAKSSSRTFLQHLRRCRNEKAEVVSEVTLRVGARQNCPVELRSVPVLDPGRGDTVYRTAMTDITERLLVGKALRESEERYRAVVELSPDGIFILIDGQIVLANRAALEFCGLTDAEKLTGRPFLDLVRPVFRQNRIVELLNAAGGPLAPPLEVKLASARGAWIEVELLARDFSYEGQRAVLVMARDIRRRRQAERQVLKISEREKVRFGQDLHDGLCQSLGGAACLAEALRNRLRRSEAGEAQAAGEIAQLVRQCMDEARSLAKGLYPVGMETTGLISALHALAGEVAERAGIACAVQCPETIAIHDTTVATNLYRIAQEAIANAIKHGRAKSVSIELEEAGSRATLRLRDDGTGLPARPKETGLGLYTMRYRAAMIGGLLELQRDGRRGTVVTCTFPVDGKAS